MNNNTTPNTLTSPASSNDHVVAVVEPTGGDHPELQVARDAIARGGRATLVLVITDRVRGDIRAFADSEGLHVHDAQPDALERIAASVESEMGDSARSMMVASGDVISAVASADDATSIVVPKNLLGRDGLWDLASRTHVPITLAA